MQHSSTFAVYAGSPEGMRSRMWSMQPSYATPTSARLYQSVIENMVDLQDCDCAHMHGLRQCRPWVEQFDKQQD
jgi:hypothetical protein